MFDLQNMTYEDFINANTNYENVDQEEYLDAIHVSLEEYQIISFENDLTIMFVSESIQNDVGTWTTLVEEDIQY